MTSLTTTTTPTSNVVTAGGWQVVNITNLGNCVVATQNFNIGHVVFRERPVVSASWFEYRCTCCSQMHSVTQCPLAPTLFSRQIINNLTEIEEELSNLFAIQELDKARTFLLAIQQASIHPHVRDRILSLTQANLDTCIATVDLIKRSTTMSKILPNESLLSTKQCAMILSALNTNAHMLEDGGSALFPEAGAMFEHSCTPNW